uniref:NADH-ubiquinone oxidoreductase chain 2 n=1 Tax=Staphylinoidea sp. 5 KM-2017 TaxID=2219459 RepID=A0A346RIM4_9COLE|nr:NADH dehydrogenase subunit 2 [Staphylinoidea sp. 5 KM-2017]
MLFFLILLSTNFIILSSSSWFGMWVALEVNLLSIIPLMTSKSSLNSEASMKYFIIQAISSSMILFSLIISKNFMEFTNIMAIMNLSLLLKLGVPPLHFWVPEVLEGLTWNSCFLILGPQKIGPMIMLMYMTNNLTLMLIFIISSMVVSAILGVYQTSLRKLMAFSSMNHLGWMLSSMIFTEKIWVIYISIYTFITFLVCKLFQIFNISSIKNFSQAFSNSLLSKMMIMTSVLSLAGLPPFLGFLPKWLIILTLMENNMILLGFLMVILTLIPIFFYIRVSMFPIILVGTNQLNLKFNLLISHATIILSSINTFGLIFSTCLFNVF